MELYGWLIGSWDLDVTEFSADGTERRRAGEWHFGWVLEGRAVQDVWIVPPRRQRDAPDTTTAGAYYGTTLRVYDPRIDAWHIAWTEPVGQAYLTQIGRRHGDRIVQEGRDTVGNLRRWTFSDITPDSFRWRGEVFSDDGSTWHCHMDFTARRTSHVPITGSTAAT